MYVKNFFKLFIPYLILAVVIFHYRDKIITEFWPRLDYLRQIIFKTTPCDKTIAYNIGTFDPRFKISEEYFISALREAEAVWEKPTGIDLFAHNSEYTRYDLLKINLIYDHRQEATDKLKSLGVDVDENRANYEKLKAKYDTLKAEYDRDKKNVNTQADIERLNNLADEINALVVVLNRLVKTLNLSVERYNDTSSSRGETFEEGIYESDGINQQINIYEFSNRDKLVRVLAHEFGHALLLDHVEDPKAIMYEFNHSTNVSVTEADLNELKNKCQPQ
jgi:hypothetical protein